MPRDQLAVDMIVEAIAKGFDKVTSEVSKTADSEKKMAEATKRANEEAKKQEQQFKATTNATIAMGAALLGAATVGGKLLAGTVKLAARVETLGIVTKRLGENAGWTESEIRSLEQAIQDQGITTQASRQAIARMIQAQVDLTHATRLARIAQDAAVIGNMNSSDAFDSLIYSISTANVRMLRTLGMAVTFEKAYKTMAESIGKNTDQLTEAEKSQARVNAVLQAGEQIAGTYEAAMDTAGKKEASLARLREEAALAIGNVYLPAYTELIDTLYEGAKAFNELEVSQKSAVGAWAGYATAIAGASGATLTLLGIIGKLKMSLAAGTLGAVGGAAIAAPIIAIAASVTALGVAFKKGLDILRGGTGEINAAMQDVEQGLIGSSTTYDEYYQSVNALIKRVGEMGGFWTAYRNTYMDASGNIVDASGRIVQASFGVSESQFYLKKAMGVGSSGLQEAAESIAGVSEMYEQLSKRAGVAVNEISEWQRQVGESGFEATIQRMLMLDFEVDMEDPEEAVQQARDYIAETNQRAQELIDASQERLLAETEMEVRLRISRTGIASEIESFMQELDFAMAGGKEVSLAFETVRLGIEDMKITPDQGREYLDGLLVAAQQVGIEAGQITAEAAAENLSETLGITTQEALAQLQTVNLEDLMGQFEIDKAAIVSKEDRDNMLNFIEGGEGISEVAEGFERWSNSITTAEQPFSNITSTTLEYAETTPQASEAASQFGENMGEAKEQVAELISPLTTIISLQQQLKDKHVSWTVDYQINVSGSGSAGLYGQRGGHWFGQHGGDFIVPPGFPNDSFTMHVSSGERVVVQPPGRGAQPAVQQSSGDRPILVNQHYHTREAAAMGNALISMLENNRLNGAMGG